MRHPLRQLTGLFRRIGRRLVPPRRTPIDRPTFLIGTGRCGSSLLVEMLDSHPDLAGYPGEANRLWHPSLYPLEKTDLKTAPIEMDGEAFTRLSLKHWPEGHAETVRAAFERFLAQAGSHKKFFAKSAMVSFMMPRIRTIFPQARFIHLYRYGPSVITSYVKKNHGKYPNFEVSKDQYRLACAQYWNDCLLRIERDRKNLGLRTGVDFYELSYESLCENPQHILEDLGRFFDVSADQFAFDVETVKSTNFKA
ncbi:MAG: sulfotransferase, partial [Phycisphaeraceae bacterium]|nr:sulfotransferase [Phycisphaeraceae bacterium]